MNICNSNKNSHNILLHWSLAGSGVQAGHHIHRGAEATPHPLVLCRQEGAVGQVREHPRGNHCRRGDHTPHRIRLLPLQPPRNTGVFTFVSSRVNT